MPAPCCTRRAAPFIWWGSATPISGPTIRRWRLSGVPQGADALCFTHSPDSFPKLPGTCVLTIAGHTHGGQVKLPLLGRADCAVPSMASVMLPGIIREDGKTLFVSTGIGTSILPVRLGVPPEIALLTLR